MKYSHFESVVCVERGRKINREEKMKFFFVCFCIFYFREYPMSIFQFFKGREGMRSVKVNFYED